MGVEPRPSGEHCGGRNRTVPLCRRKAALLPARGRHLAGRSGGRAAGSRRIVRLETPRQYAGEQSVAAIGCSKRPNLHVWRPRSYAGEPLGEPTGQIRSGKRLLVHRGPRPGGMGAGQPWSPSKTGFTCSEGAGRGSSGQFLNSRAPQPCQSCGGESSSSKGTRRA
jgi:hypothetical protein